MRCTSSGRQANHPSRSPPARAERMSFSLSIRTHVQICSADVAHQHRESDFCDSATHVPAEGSETSQRTACISGLRLGKRCSGRHRRRTLRRKQGRTAVAFHEHAAPPDSSATDSPTSGVSRFFPLLALLGTREEKLDESQVCFESTISLVFTEAGSSGSAFGRGPVRL